MCVASLAPLSEEATGWPIDPARDRLAAAFPSARVSEVATAPAQGAAASGSGWTWDGQVAVITLGGP